MNQDNAKPVAADVARAARNFLTLSGTLNYTLEQVQKSHSPDETFNLLGGLMDAAISITMTKAAVAPQEQAPAGTPVMPETMPDYVEKAIMAEFYKGNLVRMSGPARIYRAIFAALQSQPQQVTEHD